MVNVKKWDSWDEEPEDKPLFKPTIINLTENGTTIHNNGSEPIIEEYSTSSTSSISSHSFNDITNSNIQFRNNNVNNPSGNEIPEDMYSVSQKQRETKTVVVEVHRSDVAEKDKNDNGHLALMKSSSTSSFCSIASKSSCTSSITSSMTNSSLSSAITLEIQRRQVGYYFILYC